MSDIVIASGKGGTGKTSVTGALAQLAQKVVLVDCDVDAANLHLLVDFETMRTHEFSTSRKAEIDTAICSSCGLCYDLCRFNAIEKAYDPCVNSEYVYSVDSLACEGCGLCYHACPDKAIGFLPVVSGEWYESKTEYGPFLHGRLGVAQANSGRLVSLLRREARKASDECGTNAIIIDGPPGIGCPVIASITGADYLLIVTEPSRSAIHDLERLIGLASHFDIPCAICINKYDINEDLTREIEVYAGGKSIPVLGKISFDRGFVDAQTDGISCLSHAKIENIRALHNIWEILKSIVPGNGRIHARNTQL